MEGAEDIRIARDIVQSLAKVRKTVRLYPENNPIYIKTIDDTFLKFTEFFNYRDELHLKIKQNEIFLDSVQMYYNPSKEENLALFFFRDGLIELRFKKGLSREELKEFLKIIALDFDREVTDDDIVTLLWERDFQNIKYVADESFLLEDEEYESKAVAEIKERAGGEQAFLEAYTDAFEARDVGEIPVINLTEKDIQLLVKEIERDREGKTGKLSAILFDMLLHTEDPVEAEYIHRFTKDLIIYSLRHRDLRPFVDIIKRAKDMAENPETPENIRAHMNRLLSLANSEEAIKYVGEIFDLEGEIDEGLLNEYIGYLQREAIMPFITVLGEAKTIRWRKRVINILIQLGKIDIHTLARGLQDPKWYVVRNIIYILRHIGDKSAMEYLLHTVTHTDPRVRKEAIKTLGELKNPMALKILKECLEDTDPSIRKSAVRAIGGIGSETAMRIILEMVSKKDFTDREFDEKKESYEVLSQWNDAEAVAFMMKTLRKKSLFRRVKFDEDRAAAAYALGLAGNKEALPALYKLKDSRNKLLREHVNTAIRMIEEHGR